MSKLIRAAAAAVLAAMVAGAFTVLPSFSDRVDASAPDAVASDTCAAQHWPYIAAGCLRDSRRAAGRARPAARVINIDRKMAER